MKKSPSEFLILKRKTVLVSIIMAIILTFQSCKVYHRDSVTLAQAAESGKQTKIETIYNQTFRYQKIIFEDGLYYGVLKHKDQISRFPIAENNIIKVRLQNKPLSTIYSVALPIAVVLGALIAVGLVFRGSLEQIIDGANNN